MFVIKKLVPSISIEGKERIAGIIHIDTKNNILEDVEEIINLEGGFAHTTHGGLVALFFEPSEESLIKIANQILQKTKELGLRAKVGIHTGRVITEEIPRKNEIKYASLGGAVGMAKKLALIENGIVVSNDIYQKIGRQLRAEKRGEGWFVKGFADEKYLKFSR